MHVPYVHYVRYMQPGCCLLAAGFQSGLMLRYVVQGMTCMYMQPGFVFALQPAGFQSKLMLGLCSCYGFAGAVASHAAGFQSGLVLCEAG